MSPTDSEQQWIEELRQEVLALRARVIAREGNVEDTATELLVIARRLLGIVVEIAAREAR